MTIRCEDLPALKSHLHCLRESAKSIQNSMLLEVGNLRRDLDLCDLDIGRLRIDKALGQDVSAALSKERYTRSCIETEIREVDYLSRDNPAMAYFMKQIEDLLKGIDEISENLRNPDIDGDHHWAEELLNRISAVLDEYPIFKPCENNLLAS